MGRHTVRLAVVVAIYALLTTATPSLAVPSSVTGCRLVPLRVASYNIHTGIGTDGRLDLARTASALRATGAEVIGLQEVDVHWAARSAWRDQANDLATMLAMRVFFAPIYDFEPAEPGKPRRQYGLAILSRYPMLSAENHWITRLSTQGGNPVPEPAPGFPEVVLNVRGARVHVYATHLDYRPDPQVRQLQVADTLRILAEARGEARVLLGDFNAEPTAPELAPLWTKLADAWGARQGPGGLTFPADVPAKRIDYVTVSYPVRVRDVRVPATQASDHLPVVADLLTIGQRVTLK